MNKRNGPVEPTFKIFAPMLKTSMGTDGKRRLHGIASSTVKDRHGDTMTASALTDMERSASSNMTIFLNHSYQVPEDVAGSVERALIRAHPQDPSIHDLSFDIVVNESNPRAVNAWEAIQNGTQLGLSIGAMIPDGGAIRDRKTGTYTIEHVELLETSLVGVPANPRSWVEYAVKSLAGKPIEEDEPTIEQVKKEDDRTPEAIPGELVVGEEIVQTELHGQDDGNPASEGKDVPVRDDEMKDVKEGIEAVIDGEPLTTSTAYHTLTTNSTSPTITDATVNIKTPYADVSIDTGNRGGKPASNDGSSQEALESAPETGEEDESTPTNPWAAIGLSGEDLVEEDLTTALRQLEPTIVASLHSSSEVLKAITRELIETKAALKAKDDELAAVVEATNRIVTQTAEIMEKLSTTPVGRRAVYREVSGQFGSLKSVYSEEFLDLLKRS